MIKQTVIDTTDELEEALSEEEIIQIKTKSVSGSIAYFVRTLFLQGIGLASAFVLSWFFEPEDFAVYGFVTQIIGLLIFFSDVGLAATLVKKESEPSEDDYKTTFTIQQILSWFIFSLTILIFFSGLVQKRFGLAGGWILLSLGLSFPLASLKTISSIKLERKLDFSKLVVPQIFEQIVFHGLLILLAWRGLGSMAYAWAITARSVIGVVVMFIIFPWKIGFKLANNSIKQLLSYGLKFQLNDLLARIKDQLFFLLVGYYLPVKSFGFINWAKNWSLYPYNLTVQNVMAVTFPTFSRLQKHKNLLKKALEKSIFFISLFIFPLLTGMCILIGPFVHVITKYQKWQPAVMSFIFFAMSIAWAALSTPLINTLNAIGKINQSLKLMLMWTVLTWILTPIMIYFFDFNGVAIAAFIISFTSILSIKFVKKEVEIKVWPNIWRQLLASFAMVLVSFQIKNFMYSNILNFLLSGVIISVTYFLALLLIDKNLILAQLKSLKIRK